MCKVADMADKVLGVQGGEPVGKHWAERLVTRLNELLHGTFLGIMLVLVKYRGERILANKMREPGTKPAHLTNEQYRWTHIMSLRSLEATKPRMKDLVQGV
jgi:hypothetical protein